MDFLKSIGSKIAAGLVAVGVVIAVLSWFLASPETHHLILSSTGKIASWTGVVLLWPWVSFAIIGKVARLDSNLAAAILVFLYTALEVTLLLYLFGWSLPGATAWTFMGVGTLISAAYNLLACDWIAEKLA